MWEEIGADFHNCLIQLYCEKVQGLMKEYLHSLPAGMFSIFWWKKQGMGQCKEASIVYCSNPELLIPRGRAKHCEGTGTMEVVGL